MSLLNFLSNSNSRNKLLALLWCEDVEASVHQLAELADIGYASAYNELRAMGKEGLAMSVKKGRSVIFKKNQAYPHADLLHRILDAEGLKRSNVESGKDVTWADIKLNLVKFGAPLGVNGESNVDLTLEESINLGLNLAREDASVARVLPVVLAKNEKHINFARMIFLARKSRLEKTLGFFLELTAKLSGRARLKKESEKLYDLRYKKFEYFFLNQNMGRFTMLLTEKNTPNLARKWRFRMNMGIDSFENLFYRFIQT